MLSMLYLKLPILYFIQYNILRIVQFGGDEI